MLFASHIKVFTIEVAVTLVWFVCLTWFIDTTMIFADFIVNTPSAMLREWMLPPSPLPASFNAIDALGNTYCLGKEIVFNQQACGACMAFATASAYGIRACLRGMSPESIPSPYRLFDCAGGDCAANTGLNTGGTMHVMSQAGVPPLLETATAFGQGCPFATPNTTTNYLKIRSYRYVCGARPIKREILVRGPGVISVLISEEALRAEKNMAQGRLELGDDYDDSESRHAMVLLGWRDEDATWLIQNSWSSEWGMQGVGSVPQSFFDCVLVFEPDPRDITS